MAATKTIVLGIVIAVVAIAIGFFTGYYMAPRPVPAAPTPTPTPTPALTKVTIISGSLGGSTYRSASAVVSAVSSDLAPKGIVLINQAGGGSAVQLPMLHERRADMAAGDIIDAKALWEEKGYKDFRAVLILSFFPAQLAVRTDAGVKCWKDLSGKPISIGSPGFIANRMFKEIMPILGIEPSKVYELGHRDSMEMLARGDIVAYLFVGFPNPTVQEFFFKYRGKMTMVPPCEDEYKLLKEKLAGYMWMKVDMSGESVYAGVDLTYEAPAAVQTLWTTPDLPTNVVYEIVKTYWKNVKVAERIYPQHKWFKPETIIEQLEVAGLPLHCGVVKYYKEAGITVPSKLVPPECKT